MKVIRNYSAVKNCVKLATRILNFWTLREIAPHETCQILRGWSVTNRSAMP